MSHVSQLKENIFRVSLSELRRRGWGRGGGGEGEGGFGGGGGGGGEIYPV